MIITLFKKTWLLVSAGIISVIYINLFLGTLFVSLLIAPIENFFTKSIDYTCDWFDFVQDSFVTIASKGIDSLFIFMSFF
jgi:hypothetical protein